MLFGDTIIFTPSNEDWHKRRHAIAPALYKGKLRDLFDLAKQMIRKCLEELKERCKDGPTEVDLRQLSGYWHGRIFLFCAFGQDLADQKIEYETGSETLVVTIAEALSRAFHDVVERAAWAHVVFFPFLLNCWWLPAEKVIARNCKRLQDYFTGVLAARREARKSNTKEA